MTAHYATKVRGIEMKTLDEIGIYEGDRIRIDIANKERYTSHCLTALNEQMGTVIVTSQAGRAYEPAYLVQFDSPVPAWYKHGLPVSFFWFPWEDIRKTFRKPNSADKGE